MIFKSYYPMPKFPPVSLSGAQCQLHCLHCNAMYLAGMRAAETPEALLVACQKLQQQGAVGVLLSGGSDKHGGILNLTSMLDTIQRIKEQTDLIINIHPGLLDASTAQNLAVDFASLEIPNTDTIRHVFQLDATTEDYVATYHHLRLADIEVIPHISVYKGDEYKLLAAIDNPYVIVVIVFSPTRHTQMHTEKAPSPETVGNVIAELRDMFPDTEIALGCMRPRSRVLREAIEFAAFEAGVSRMELPSRKVLAHIVKQGYTVRQFDACCALPVEYEGRASRN